MESQSAFDNFQKPQTSLADHAWLWSHCHFQLLWLLFPYCCKATLIRDLVAFALSNPLSAMCHLSHARHTLASPFFQKLPLLLFLRATAHVPFVRLTTLLLSLLALRPTLLAESQKVSAAHPTVVSSQAGLLHSCSCSGLRCGVQISPALCCLVL